MLRRTLGLASLAVVAVACNKSDTGKTDSATAAPPAAVSTPPAPAALTLADVAGTWNVRAVPDSGDTTATTYVLTAAADSSGWSMKYSNGLVVKPHVMASGDSIVLSAGPYASVRRKGLQVTTEGVLRKEGDKLVGRSTAHYKTTKPDSVLHLRIEGTKAP